MYLGSITLILSQLSCCQYFTLLLDVFSLLKFDYVEIQTLNWNDYNTSRNAIFFPRLHMCVWMEGLRIDWWNHPKWNFHRGQSQYLYRLIWPTYILYGFVLQLRVQFKYIGSIKALTSAQSVQSTLQNTLIYFFARLPLIFLWISFCKKGLERALM